jgi:CRISPR-associated endonuclease Csn1
MKYRVGLDIGTASLGVAAFSLDKDNNPEQLVYSKVHIFDEPVEKAPGKLIAKKAKRRQCRMQRRQIDRRLFRTRQIVKLAKEIGLTLEPDSDSGRTLLEIRAKAAREKISLADMIRVFIHLGKHRGYAGEFRNRQNGGKGKLGEVESGSNDLKIKMTELAQQLGMTEVTVGQYLLHLVNTGKSSKLKIKEPQDTSIPEPNLYALRFQVESEFNLIWQTQASHYSELNKSHKGKPLKDQFYNAIFFQRPLKSFEVMVGQCPLEKTLARSPKAQMAFQNFRIEKTLADLRWGSGRGAVALTAEQKNEIRKLCQKNETVKFEKIYSQLTKAGHRAPINKNLNLERLSRDEIPGNKTISVFKKLDLVENWLLLSETTQIQVINFLADLGNPELLDDSKWHERLYTRSGSKRNYSDDFVNFINLIKDHPKFDQFTKMGFEGGRAAYSIKALKQLTAWMQSPWWSPDTKIGSNIDEYEAIRVLYPNSIDTKIQTKARLETLPKTGNDIVDGALRQVKKIVNNMIDQLGGPPAEIIVELSREMGVGLTLRSERENEASKNKKKNDSIKTELIQHNIAPSKSNIRRYKLWEQQDMRHCVYCTKPISLADAVNGAETNYEHIIPRSLTQVNLKLSEIALAHKGCNDEKGKRTPYQTWGDNPARWNIIVHRAEELRQKAKSTKNGDIRRSLYRKAKLLLLQDFESEVLTDESIDQFADSQLHLTSWISREVAEWLQSIAKTSVSKGQLTASLRRKWRLDTVIPEVRLKTGLPVLDTEGNVITQENFSCLFKDKEAEKRIDHRHHFIDAVVIALTSRALFQKIATQYRKDSEQNPQGRFGFRIGDLTPINNLREMTMQAVSDPELLSFKVDHYISGAFFQETPYGRGRSDANKLSSRVLIRDLVPKSSGKKTISKEDVLEVIEKIDGPLIKKVVLEVFNERIASGYSAENALREPIKRRFYGRDQIIKRVKVLRRENYSEAIEVRHVDSSSKEHKKLLLSDGYAYLEIDTANNIKPKLVTNYEAAKVTGIPARDSIIRVYKGDVVEHIINRERYRVCYFRALAKNCAVLPIVEPRSFDNAYKTAPKLSGVVRSIRFVEFISLYKMV